MSLLAKLKQDYELFKNLFTREELFHLRIMLVIFFGFCVPFAVAVVMYILWIGEKINNVV